MQFFEFYAFRLLKKFEIDRNKPWALISRLEQTIKKGNLSDIHDNFFCKKYDFYVSVYYSPHTDDEIMIDTSFDSA